MMRSPAGGTSSGDLSMTTRGSPRHGKSRLTWKLYRDQAGQIKFRRLKEKPDKPSGPVTMEVTVPRKVVEDKERLRKMVERVTQNGGDIVSARGRMMSVECDSTLVEDVTYALEAFGCQWDTQ